MTTLYYQGPAPYSFTSNTNQYITDGTGAVCVLNADVAATLALPNFSQYPVASILVPKSDYGAEG